MRVSRSEALAAICIGTVVVAIAVIAIQHELLARDPIIDGWAVGVEKPYDADYIDSATEALATSHPGHAAVVRASLHNEGAYFHGGQQILATRSGNCCDVVLFELADGTRHAVGAGHPGAVAPGWTPKPMAFPNGPFKDIVAAP